MTDAVKDKKVATLMDLVDKDIPPLQDFGGRFLQKVKTLNSNGGLFDFYKENIFECLSTYHSKIMFNSLAGDKSADNFLSYMKTIMTAERCNEAVVATESQSKSSLWFDLRYGRVTASHLYEVARCKTVDGVLIEKILGALKPFQTEATKRGLLLEDKVLQVVSQKKNIKIKKCGLLLKKEFPIFGASPDGLSENYCVEVKCPSKEKTVQNYIKDNTINRRYYFQMQLQMLLSNKKEALFCVASPEFETNHNVDIYNVTFNKEECEGIMISAESFWKLHVFPNI